MSGELELARELEAQDARLAGEIEAVAELQRRAAAISATAAELEEFAASLPAERERLALAVSQAEAELAERERAHREVQAQPGEDAAAARRALVRAADLVSASQRRLSRLREEQAGLEARAVTFPAEPVRLAGEAAEIAPGLAGHDVPGPEPDPAALREWASRARAALLVERSGLDTRRERVVREANELASAVLGEQVATSAAGARERVEQAARARGRPHAPSGP